jgi:uncharacterized protein YydD (DUF2326 family)
LTTVGRSNSRFGASATRVPKSSKLPYNFDEVLAMYEQAKLTLPEAVKRRLDEVKTFHEAIVTRLFGCA